MDIAGVSSVHYKIKGQSVSLSLGKEDLTNNRQPFNYWRFNFDFHTVKRYVYGFWAMGRPLFLIGTVPLYILGITFAWHDEKSLRIPVLVSGLALVWLIQLMTHFNNEYYDLETDMATVTPTHISGGSRVLVKKILPRTAARSAAVICLLIAVILAAFMLLMMGAGILTWLFAGAAIFLGWFYSAPPLRLESTGAGEIVTALLSCFLTPLLSYYLQTSVISLRLLLGCLPLSLLTLALITTTEVLDFPADQASGKVTLIVRLGARRSMWLLVSTLFAGWVIFSTVIVHFWPFWGWISVASTLPFLVLIGLNLRSAADLSIARLERLGLIIAVLVGYTSILLNIAFLV